MAQPCGHPACGGQPVTRLSCAAGCTLRSRHLDDCGDPEQCRGCLPALAADGSHVCSLCDEKARRALRELPGLWVDVEDAGTLKGRQNGTRGSGRPLPIDPDAADWRQRLRACLVTWVKVLEEDFGANLDGCQDTVQWMADKVGIYAGRLLASEHADQLCSDLLGSTDEDGKRHGDLWGEGRRLAFRSASSQPMRIKCVCGERVRVDPDNLMECRNCGEWGDINHWMRFAPEIPGPRTAQDTINWLLVKHGQQVQYDTLRQWRVRHASIAAGRDDKGRALYDGDAVLMLVQRTRRIVC